MSVQKARTTWRQRGMVLLVAFALVGAFANLSSLGASAATSKSPVKVAVTSVVSSVTTPPGAAGAPTALIQAGRTFDVTVELQNADDKAYAVSSSKDTVLSIAVTSGSATFDAGVITTATIPGGGTAATFAGLVLAPPANQVVLTVSVIDGTNAALDLAPGSTAPFDVVVSSETKPVPGDRSRSLVVSRQGVDVPCEATEAVTTCVDLVLPQGLQGDSVFFSTGLCDASVGCASDKDLLQVLADLGPSYDRRNPATIIFKCDKVACPGKGVPSYTLKVNLDAVGPLADASACRSKGVIPSNLTSCVDYVQSKRDGSGDLYLYWLVSRDARGSCC